MRLTDVHRSLRRWAGFVLGEDWIIRLEQRLTGEDDLKRDIAFVEIAVPVSSTFARSGGVGDLQGDTERQATFSITLLPCPSPTPQESSLRAYSLAEDLFRGAEAGIVRTDGVSVSPPLQVPLWDWEGVPVVGKNRSGPAGLPLRFAEIIDPSARPLPDPADDRLFSVVLTMRLRWLAGGRGLPPLPVADGGVVMEIDPPLA